MSLVYDVGMHTGDDSAFYLHQGHSVVAVEAVRQFVDAALLRFHKEIESRRLTVVNCAIAEECGERPFFVSDDHPEWSSFDPSIAGRDGATYQETTVTTSGFGDIVRKWGRPHYLKVDIEGADSLCIKDLEESNLPAYVSVESECGGSEIPLTEAQFLGNFRLLRERGYDRFKLVNQQSLVPLTRSNLKNVWNPAYRALMRQKTEALNGWTFIEGSSGPWGNGILGPWMDFSEAVDLYCTCRELFFRTGGKPLYWFWFDWHATRAGPGA